MELSTNWLPGLDSNQQRQDSKLWSCLPIGSRGWTRTSNARIQSPVFYQLNYPGPQSFLETLRRIA